LPAHCFPYPIKPAYAHSAGALGYPGLGWSLLVRVPESVTLADQIEVQRQMGLVLIVCGVGILALSLGISNALVRPLRTLVARLTDISSGEGDLTRRIDLDRSDEIGALAAAFNTFVAKLCGIIANVKTSASDVSSVASQIAASSEEMSAAVDEVARQTAEVSTTAQDSGTLAESGRDVVEKTVSEMNAITDTVERTALTVGELGSRGEAISKLVEVINDIADQTNLLALNAAIEAARAGEHGRGFAVVADEVRKLAERTTKATDEIGGSVSAITSETRQAVEQMTRGQAQVRAGADLAAQAGASLERIVQGSTSVAGMIQAISAAAEEAGAGARESAGAATALSDKAEQLSVLVAQFKTS